MIPNNPLQKVRVDKWLWSVRIFKSRTLATDACKTSRVKINGQNAKPSDCVQVGHLLEVKKDGFNLQYKVVALIEKRVSATLAEPCYENLTPQAELQKFNTSFVSENMVEVRDKGTGRPTKKDRRAIERFKDFD